MPALLFATLVLAGSPEARDAGTPDPGWRFDQKLNVRQAMANCRAENPQCKGTWVEFDVPPHPCANRGAVCPPELLNATTTSSGYWICGCDECGKDADCGKGLVCRAEPPADPCATTGHRPRKCVAKPKPEKKKIGEASAVVAPCLPPSPPP